MGNPTVRGALEGRRGVARFTCVCVCVCVCVCRIPRRRGCLPRVGGGPEISHCPGRVAVD